MFNEYLPAPGTQGYIILVSDVFILTTQHLHYLQILSFILVVLANSLANFRHMDIFLLRKWVPFDEG